MGEPAIPPEILIARLRQQLADQLGEAYKRETEAQKQRIETEQARATANEQPRLVEAQIAVQVANQGALDVEAGVSWAFYKLDGDTRTLVTTGTLDAIPSGVALEGFAVTVGPEDIGANGFVLVIDDDGTGVETVGECDEDNNTELWLDAICG